MRLIVESLAQSRGGRTIFTGVSFALGAGEALVLTGPNGAGKTTLLRTIAGFMRPATGSVRLEGGLLDAEIGEQAHYVGHLNALKLSLTVTENAAFWRAWNSLHRGRTRRIGPSGEVPERSGSGSALPHDAVHAALARIGLAGLVDIPAGMLSAGQKRRLGLVRLLLTHRPLWLLDEPTVSLDAEGQGVLAAIIAGHRAAGGLLIAATHAPLGLENSRELRLDAGAAAA